MLLNKKQGGDKMNNEPLYRRFEITCGEEEKKALLTLIDKKGLNRLDLMLILKSMRVSSDFDKSQSHD